MILCLCNVVTDSQVTSAIEAGARSADDVAARTGAGAGCGCCREAIEQMIAGATPLARDACGRRCADCPRGAASAAAAA